MKYEHISFLNGLTEESLANQPLFKLYDLIFGLNSLTHDYIWCSKPDKWKDPFESFFYRSTYNSMSFGLKDRCAITCFSSIRTQEPQWGLYGRNNESMRFQYNVPNLLSSANNFCTKNKCHIYIGKVIYQDTKFIKSFNPKSINSSPYTNWSDSDWVQLMLYKRNAFLYENEIRLIVVFDDAINNNSSGIQLYGTNNLSTVDVIQLWPTNDEIRRETIRDILIDDFKFTPRLNKTGTMQPRVTLSRLYQHVQNKSF